MTRGGHPSCEHEGQQLDLAHLSLSREATEGPRPVDSSARLKKKLRTYEARKEDCKTAQYNINDNVMRA